MLQCLELYALFRRPKTFSGICEEHMDSTISVIETIATINGVVSSNQIKAILIMLFRDALMYRGS